MRFLDTGSTGQTADNDISFTLQFVITLHLTILLVIDFYLECISESLKDMLYYIICRLKHLLLAVGSIFSKIFCCFRRRRRNSDSIIPVNVAKTASNFINDVAGGTNWDYDDWDNCEIVIDKPKTTQDHIAAYRHQVAVRQNSAGLPEATEPEVDLFAGMVPDIKKQRKVFVGQEGREDRGGQRRLSVASAEAAPLVSMGSELANWEEEESLNQQGWDCEEELSDALRSHRRAKR